MDILQSFKARVEAALQAHDLAPSAFGTEALRDPSFVFDLRKTKREPKLRTMAKVENFIAKLERRKPVKKRRAAA